MYLIGLGQPLVILGVIDLVLIVLTVLGAGEYAGMTAWTISVQIGVCHE